MPRNGQTAWVDATSRDRGGFAAVLDAGSAILALPSDGQLIAFKPGDKQYEELAVIKVADTSTYAHPVIAGKRIFVKDQDSLTLWALK